MFSFNSDKEKEKSSEERGELEQFFEDEDWDIGQKGGEVSKDSEQDIDWSNYDFMYTFDDAPDEDSNKTES